MAYERYIDLMDEALFPRDFLYARKKNPKEPVSRDSLRVELTNNEIIDFVAGEMSETLGR
jgi:hypothetical protein